MQPLDHCSILRHVAAKTAQHAAPQSDASGVNEPQLEKEKLQKTLN